MGICRLKRKTIFRQIAIAFTGIVFPIVVLGMLLVLWQTNITMGEIKGKVENDVYYGMQRLENQLSLMEEVCVSLMSAEEVQRFSLYHNKSFVYEYYTMINDVVKRMEIAREVSDCIKDISIYYPESNVSVSLSNGYNRPMTEEFAPMDERIREKRAVVFEKDNIYLLYGYPIFAAEGARKFIIRLDLSVERVFQEYLLKDIEDQAYLFLYDWESEQFLYLPKKGINGVVQALIPRIDGLGESEEILCEGQKYLAVTEESEYREISLIQCVPTVQIMRIQKLFYGMLAVYLLFSILLMLFYFYSVKRLVNSPINQLIEAFKKVEKEDLQVRISYQAADEFNYLYREFNCMVERLGILIDENYKAKLGAQKAELKQLQAQISPHFLYNTYFILNRMILEEDFEYAQLLSKHLGIYMEYVTHNSQEETFLEKEIEHIRSYLEIQGIRFSNRMRFSIQPLPPTLAKEKVPRLILQPVVENYCKYGYEKANGSGDLRVEFEIKENGFCVIVSGGGVRLTETKIEEMRQSLIAEGQMVEVTGLINVHRRLCIRYGPGSGICLLRDEDGHLITKLIMNRKEEGKDV